MKRHRVHLVRWLSALLLVAFAAETPATTVIRRSTEELTVLSELVAEGQVVSVEPRLREDHQFIYTYVTVEVEAVHKGRLREERIVLEELGGSVDGVTATVHGVPQFEPGERVIVFLDVVDGHYRCHGFAQGKFTVATDEAGETIVTRPELVELTFNRSHSGELDSTVDPATGRRAYDGFVATIEAWADRLVAPGGE